MRTVMAAWEFLSRRLSFFPLLALAAGCLGQDDEAGLRPVDWPGRDGQAVVLNAELRVEFDRPLALGLRAGACRLFELDTGEGVNAGLEVVGRFLIFRPALPLRADLSDGGLAPDCDYGIDLHGVPRLAAVVGEDGAALTGTRRIQFRTLPAAEPGALVALDGGGEALRVLPLGTANKHFDVRADGTVRILLTGPVDPRTLEGARLASNEAGGAGAAPVPVALRLLRNAPDQAEIEANVGRWAGWRRLELPPGLEGFGGKPLQPSDRSLGLRGGS